MSATKHNPEVCRMSFGRPRPETGCPRCIELAQGAEPRRWARTRETQEARNARFRAELDTHINSHTHKSGGCGPVCTFGEW